MFDPSDLATYRAMEQMRRDHAKLLGIHNTLDLRRTLSTLEPWHIDKATGSAIYPHYKTLLNAKDLLGRQSVTDIAQQIALAGKLPSHEQLGFDRNLMALLGDRPKLEAALLHGFGSGVSLIEEINRAQAAVVEQARVSSGLLSTFGLQEVAAGALAMRARLEDSLGVGAIHRDLRRAVTGLSVLTERATSVWEHFGDDPTTLLTTPEFLREMPTRQVALATRSIGLLVSADPEFASDEALLSADSRTELEELLARVNPEFLELYRGARDAVARRGPDYIRQATSSLRELFKYLLRAVAPDAEIRAWDITVLPLKGGATYRARLEYVFRVCVASKAYGRMAKHDIDHVLQNFFVLEGEGVHKLTSDLEYEEVRLLVTRCEFDLLMVLRAHQLAAGL